jgi:hypothetical protein
MRDYVINALIILAPALVVSVAMGVMLGNADKVKASTVPTYGPYDTLRIGTITKHPHGTIYTQAEALFEMADGYYVSVHGNTAPDKVVAEGTARAWFGTNDGEAVGIDTYNVPNYTPYSPTQLQQQARGGGYGSGIGTSGVFTDVREEE